MDQLSNDDTTVEANTLETAADSSTASRQTALIKKALS